MPLVCQYESRDAAQPTPACNQNSYRGLHEQRFYSFYFFYSFQSSCLPTELPIRVPCPGVLSGRDMKMEPSQSIDHVENSWNYVSITPPPPPPSPGRCGNIYVRTGPARSLLFCLLYVTSRFFYVCVLFFQLSNPRCVIFNQQNVCKNLQSKTTFY